MTRTYLGWGRSNAWGMALAHDLGASAFFTGEAQGQRRSDPLLKRYWLDVIASRRKIAELSPDLLIMQVPPSFVPLVVFGTKGRVRRWGLDMHSGVVNLWRWRWMLPALRQAARRAAFTIVHNREIAEIIDPWPSPVFVIDSYVVPSDELTTTKKASIHGPIVVVASGASDEPLDVVAQAGALLPGCEVIITGIAQRIQKRIRGRVLPSNVTLSGYLKREEYLKVVASSCLVVCLTNRSSTMQLGAWEALSLGCPVVVSNHRVMRDSLLSGARFASHNAVDLANAIIAVRADYKSYLAGAQRMATLLATGRQKQIALLSHHIDASMLQR